MTALALNWFEDQDPRDLRRWVMAAAIVLGVHLAAIGVYLYEHRPDDIGDDSSVVAVELSPMESDIDQPEVAPVPETQEKQVEQTPPDEAPTIVPPPEEKPVEQPAEQKPPTPAMPARVKGGAPRVEPSWQTGLIKHLQQYKRYPSDAQSRGEEGVVMLSFSVDRNGHVLARQVVHSSGFPELDAEVIAMIARAEPLPPFPASMTEAKLDLTVPIRFSLR
jgi:protein TonB